MPDIIGPDPELHARVMAGAADDSDLEKWVGQEALHEHLRQSREFRGWYEHVMQPCGFDENACLYLFADDMDMTTFLQQASPEAVDAYLSPDGRQRQREFAAGGAR